MTRLGRVALAAVPDLALLAGVGMVDAGVYLLAGLAVALILAGAVLAAAGWLASGAPRPRRR